MIINLDERILILKIWLLKNINYAQSKDVLPILRNIHIMNMAVFLGFRAFSVNNIFEYSKHFFYAQRAIGLSALPINAQNPEKLMTNTFCLN
jgi:hypothetical protein